MAGSSKRKYQALKDSKTLEKAPVDPKRKEKLDERASDLNIKGLKDAELAQLYTKAKLEDDRLEELVKDNNLTIEVLSTELVSRLEDSGLTQITLDNGDTFYIKDSPYCSVSDKQLWLGWIQETGQTELLSVHYKTMEGVVSNMLLKGQPLPPGIKAYIVSKIVRLPARESHS